MLLLGRSYRFTGTSELRRIPLLRTPANRALRDLPYTLSSVRRSCSPSVETRHRWRPHRTGSVGQLRLGQGARGEERAAGAEDLRDEVDDHLVDQPELERLAADPTGCLTSSLSSAMNPSSETTAPIIALPVCISFLGRCLRPVGRGDALGVASRPLDQLDPVAVWVDNERRPEAVLALLAGRDGPDPLGS